MHILIFFFFQKKTPTVAILYITNFSFNILVVCSGKKMVKIFQPREVSGAVDGASVRTLSMCWCWAVSESLQTGLVNRREMVSVLQNNGFLKMWVVVTREWPIVLFTRLLDFCISVAGCHNLKSQHCSAA